MTDSAEELHGLEEGPWEVCSNVALTVCLSGLHMILSTAGPTTMNELVPDKVWGHMVLIKSYCINQAFWSLSIFW